MVKKAIFAPREGRGEQQGGSSYRNIYYGNREEQEDRPDGRAPFGYECDHCQNAAYPLSLYIVRSMNGAYHDVWVCWECRPLFEQLADCEVAG